MTLFQGCRGEQLIIGVDGEILIRPVEIAFRQIDRRDLNDRAHVLEAKAERGEFRRIDLDPDRAASVRP